MNEVALIEMGQYLNNFKIPDIPEDTNFWLIRTMSGYFYAEFVREEYVALGWNHITQEDSFNKNNIELLKEQIKERYGDKRPGVSVNKCIRFIKEVKQGDYVLIPNAGGSEVTIGILGEYYEEDYDYLKELIDILGLERRINHLPNELSGGQQQRVSIGRALISRPDIILADEPTGNLDSKASREIMDLLRLSNEKYGQTIIMITHDMNLAKTADRIITLEDGHIVKDEKIK